MKDTPRTDEEEHRLKKLYDASSDLEWPSFNAVADFTLCRQIERELNAANAKIRQQQLLEEENMRLKAHIIGPSALIDELEIERDRIAKLLKAQQRGTSNAEKMLCEILEVDDGSQILDAIQGLKARIKRLEEAGDALAENADLNSECDMHAVCQWREAKEAKP